MPDLTLRGALYRLTQKAKGVGYSSPWRTIEDITKDEEVLADANEAFLGQVLLHAHRNVPYYRSLLEEEGVVKGEKVDLSGIARIPPLTKGMIRRNYEDLVSRDAPRRRTYTDTTAGSTGEPNQVMKDTGYDGWRLATLLHYYEETLGVDFVGSRQLILASPTRIPRRGLERMLGELLRNAVRLNGHLLSEEAMEDHVRRINSFRPELIYGLAQSLHVLSRFIERRGLRVHRPKAILSTAEPLHDYMRKEIEGAFGTRVYDIYGAVEADPIAGECRSGSMHIFSYDSYVELLEVAGSGGAREVVVTPLHNFVMPLLRYRMGDVVLSTPPKCDCGSVLPTIGRIAGREMDFFVREDGTLVHGSNFLILGDAKWVRAFQVIQEDYRRIRILLDSDRTDIAWQRHVDDEIRLVMGPDCRIIWEPVDVVPEALAGKGVFVKSLIGRRGEP
jgi:phenylacetate-CoA ligase